MMSEILVAEEQNETMKEMLAMTVDLEKQNTELKEAVAFQKECYAAAQRETDIEHVRYLDEQVKVGALKIKISELSCKIQHKNKLFEEWGAENNELKKELKLSNEGLIKENHRADKNAAIAEAVKDLSHQVCEQKEKLTKKIRALELEVMCAGIEECYYDKNFGWGQVGSAEEFKEYLTGRMEGETWSGFTLEEVCDAFDLDEHIENANE
jgi:hypothetical protein